MSQDADPQKAVIAAIEGVDKRLEHGMAGVSRTLQGIIETHAGERIAQDRRNAKFSSRDDVIDRVTAATDRMGRIEDGLARAQELGASRQDIVSVMGRLDTMTSRIDVLSEGIAATAPRIAMAEGAISELRATSAPAVQLAGLESRVAEVSNRVDLMDQGQSSRILGLSTQLTAWLVTVLFLVMGAMVTYVLSH